MCSTAILNLCGIQVPAVLVPNPTPTPPTPPTPTPPTPTPTPTPVLTGAACAAAFSTAANGACLGSTTSPRNYTLCCPALTALGGGCLSEVTAGMTAAGDTASLTAL